MIEDESKTNAEQPEPAGGEKPLRVRRSVRELQKMYDAGDKEPLEDLIRAWRGIQALEPDDYHSFFVIAGYHGEPFRDQERAASPEYWGGYCNHGNVLFPTWHRLYVLRLEQALQTIVPDVMMPYWDETSEETREHGIPSVLTDEKFVLDGEEIDNPLQSYVLPKQIDDDDEDEEHYTKPKGYRTVRYPLSGLVGTPDDLEQTQRHNEKYPDHQTNVAHLNRNITTWLEQGRVDPGQEPTPPSVYSDFRHCLDAPNYTVFSNTTSAGAWSDQSAHHVTSLEQPHNSIHLAIGGFDVPSEEPEFGILAGANGDMGENNTASFDPIFFFHHCFIDRLFWMWQVKHGYTDHLDIIDGGPGTRASTSVQGPAAGQDPDEPLSMQTPLKPFLRDRTDPRSYLTSEDCINIEKQLGFTYSEGSLSSIANAGLTSVAGASARPRLRVSGLNRAGVRGSFVISAQAKIDEHWINLGHRAVLSRWNVANCANCQTHLNVTAFFPLDAVPEHLRNQDIFEAYVRYRNGGKVRIAKKQLEVIGLE